ncbi:hypothetical protein CDD80_7479 [Ophiocordyceps camponoti-rufipedis]|uniref:Enoyl reductase (ER) domain-containing protein n=1 Tax=Ophiocordyceps camponoti-rufipedis TaxID=2004952 RepID=A0A2C5ZAG7_9HYPO|nr:hypothetical protein CDD80_7479 [Ophiocordyceps camponoti-rufipedis]
MKSSSIWHDVNIMALNGKTWMENCSAQAMAGEDRESTAAETQQQSDIEIDPVMHENGATSSIVAVGKESWRLAIWVDEFTFISFHTGNREGIASTRLEWLPDIDCLSADHTLIERRGNCILVEKLALIGILQSLHVIGSFDETPSGHLVKCAAWMKDEKNVMISGENTFPEEQQCKLMKPSELKDAEEAVLEESQTSSDPMFRRLGEVVGADDRINNFCNLQCTFTAAELFRLRGHAKPTMKVLEIGAGTGSLTRDIVQLLSCEDGVRMYGSYVFSDISPWFFTSARGALLPRHDGADHQAFKTLLFRYKGGVLWLTRSSQIACSYPRYSLVNGGARTVRVKLIRDFWTAELQKPGRSLILTAVLAIARKFFGRTPVNFSADNEFAVHDGIIYATVGSETKAEVLVNKHGISQERLFSSRNVSFLDDALRVTNGRGVKVVLNSLSSELLHAPRQVANGFKEFIAQGHMKPAQPIHHFSADNAAVAVRFMRTGEHMRKIVVTIPKIQPPSKTNLDILVPISSTSEMTANLGQVNYAAAGCFLDSFVQYRRGLGLPCSVVDLGAVEGVGVLGDKQAKLEQYAYFRGQTLCNQNVVEAIQLAVMRSSPENKPVPISPRFSYYNESSSRSSVVPRIVSPLQTTLEPVLLTT